MAVTYDSYVKNTTDFIEKVTGIEIPKDALLFSMDEENLYTNIDNNSGIEAVKQAFLRNPDFDRPDVDILELLKISLEHNDFVFASNWYLQISICPQLCQRFHGRIGKTSTKEMQQITFDLSTIFGRYFWYLDPR